MNAAALSYAVESLISTEPSLDRDMVARILRAGFPLYTDYFGNNDVTEFRRKIVDARAGSEFSVDVAGTLLNEAEDMFRILQSRVMEAESKADEASEQPWPQWAEAIFDRLKSLGVYENGVDYADGIDLAADFEDWVDGFEAACEGEKTRLQSRVAGLERQIADAQVAFAAGLVSVAQDAGSEVLLERAAYFRRTDGHYDRSQAAGSYDASSKDVRAAIAKKLTAAIEAGGGKVGAEVVDYRQVERDTKYLVEVEVAGRRITTNMLDDRDRAEYEAAEWEWLLRGGTPPDASGFDGPVLRHRDVTEDREVSRAYEKAIEQIAGVDEAEFVRDPYWAIRVAGAARREVRAIRARGVDTQARVDSEGEDPMLALEEIRFAVFGDIGSNPDVYADYDRLTELSGKMTRALRAIDIVMRERGQIQSELHDAKRMLLRTMDERMGKAFYVEVCRAEDRIKDMAALARETVDLVPPDSFGDSQNRLLRVINEIQGGTIIPDQQSRAEEALDALPDDIRSKGWFVAAHNDTRKDGRPGCFWLFTKDGLAVQGQGASDAEALRAVRGRIAAIPEWGAGVIKDLQFEPSDVGNSDGQA